MTRENVHYKEMRRSVKRILFEPDYEYLLRSYEMITKESGSLMHKTLRLDNILAIGRYLATLGANKKGLMTLKDGMMDFLRKMLIKSQNKITPREQ